ncbi:MAG: ATP-binding cassette domain-containing protein [Xanthomonadales bacterium]|uniref:ABC transporter ATP-binding protein n=1 Tax=Hydrogenophaga sp. TaxID=1904254 RepID=UPI0016A79A8F|nr:ABC transporter ATP-binding protein [Hydrogenophaga sp.]NIM71384.1 ATP-binding cassette domain-containing protein [Xanthomonadales bacterium]NIN32303.1 ATP-binding cassette domain-containing protein [Hydrogenophaga sp.]NIN60543.1 ATP-binding cassette domain-containing protein [Xanthomonadales bacterium]NIN75895.1 ATP-binding cassette domain-containing protein [Xanthomonadales bacterium]NIO13033.1 ATP-binding cassette domain-containing protein [Xanthomonadales bacterium]
MAHLLLSEHPDFRAIARRHQASVMLATVLMSLASLLALGVPLALKNLVEELTAGGDYLRWAAVGALLLAAGLGLQAIGRLRSTLVFEQLKTRMRLRLFEKLLGQRLAFHREHGAGDLTSALYTDIDQFSTLYTSLIPSAVAGALIVMGALFALARLDPLLAGVLFAAAAIVFSGARLLLRHFRNISRDLHDQYSDIYRTIDETLHQVLVIKSHRLNRWASERLRGKLEAVIDLSVRLQFYHGMLSLTVQVLLAGALLTSWVLLARSADTAALGTQLSALLYGLLLVRQVGSAAGLVARYRQAQGAMDRLQELLAGRTGEPEPEPASPPLEPLRRLEIAGLDFRYAERPVLRAVHLTLEAGQRVALVGPNGAGKTTLLNLLIGLERPPAGVMRWNGHDLAAIPAERLRRSVAYMPQDSLLTQASIADNIRMGRLDASDQDLWAAARRAGVERLIRSQAAGMETVLGAEGSKLSGGEQRRLALARLLIRPGADLYLLDEPTEGLDPEAEQGIITTALDALQGKTVLLVTHRPAVLAYVDRVLRLDDGVLTELPQGEAALA